MEESSWSEFGVLGTIITVCLGVIGKVFLSMQKKIDDNDKELRAELAVSRKEVSELRDRFDTDLLSFATENRRVIEENSRFLGEASEALKDNARAFQQIARHLEAKEA